MKLIVSIYNNALLLILVVWSVIFFSRGIPMTYAQTIESNNTPLTASDNIFNNFKEWALFNFVKQFEYTVDIGADQVFPNKTIKHKIVDRYEPSEYALPMLKYSMLGFDMSATDIRIKTKS